MNSYNITKTYECGCRILDRVHQFQCLLWVDTVIKYSTNLYEGLEDDPPQA